MLYCKLEWGTRYLFVLDHPMVNNYFRYPSSTWVLDKILNRGIQAFSFLCTFIPGSEKSTERTFAPVELSFRGTRERTFQELSFRGTFAPVELLFLGSERSKNFRSYETVVPWEWIFQELSLQMS